MASTSSASKQQATKATDRKTDRVVTDRKATDRKATDAAATYVRETGQRAVDVPVGAVLTARDRVNGVVQPWTKSETRSEELQGLRDQVRSELGKFERRGGQARRKATQRVRETRSGVTGRVRRVPSAVKDGRGRVEDVLVRARDSIGGGASSSAASSSSSSPAAS